MQQQLSTDMALFWQSSLLDLMSSSLCTSLVMQEETLPQSTSSAQRALKYSSEGIQRGENCGTESLRDKDFNEMKKKSIFWLQKAKELKQKKEIARNFLPRPGRKLS